MDSFWKRWQREYLLDLRTVHQVRKQPKVNEIRVGDIVLLQEVVRLRHTRKKAGVEELILSLYKRVHTCVLRCNMDAHFPDLVIPLEVDQGGEDIALEKRR